MTLLEKAKSIPMRSYDTSDISEQHVDLAVSWAKGRLHYSQVRQALGIRTGSMQTYVTLARSLREAFSRGIIK